jgi:hypothetical protein
MSVQVTVTKSFGRVPDVSFLFTFRRLRDDPRGNGLNDGQRNTALVLEELMSGAVHPHTPRAVGSELIDQLEHRTDGDPRVALGVDGQQRARESIGAAQNVLPGPPHSHHRAQRRPRRLLDFSSDRNVLAHSGSPNAESYDATRCGSFGIGNFG